ncbi:hypothetical protein COLO4_19764 [Corchorus olitorius]|uniref:Uncharacterized protein n=1 Tax=Corchorus olitorius TaxID=93759 RepID=A0A1R3J3T2_9ROSI|nr:hypothetical protein COLO4_19764 [Corchorus olitorius]
MGKVFLTCFQQFLLRDENPSSNSTIANADHHHHEAIQVFANSIALDLQSLQGSLSANTPSFKWCSDVVNLLRKMHFHLLCFVQNSKASMVWGIEEYMKETLTLLDFCNSLKTAISDMNRYRLLINVAAKKLQDELPALSTSLSSKVNEIERESQKLCCNINDPKWKDLKNYLINLQEMPKTKRKDVNLGLVYAVKGSMGILCQILLSTILFSGSVKVDHHGGFLYTNFPPQLKLLSVSLRKLINSFNEAVDHVHVHGINKSCVIRPVLVENKVIESKVFEASRGMAIDEEEYMKIIDSLIDKCVGLKEGLEMFEFAITELFDEIIKGRNKVLGMVVTC